jgi:hypothetical protein
MPIATYLLPTSEIVALVRKGNRARAMFLWVKMPHQLLNGVRIRPSLVTAQAMVQSVQLGIHTLPMCVCEGDYRTYGL